MDKAISAAEASREFSRLLEEVENGNSYIVTNHGRAVARIAPVEEGNRFMLEARKALLDELRSRPAIDIGPWTRDELYER